MVRIAKALFALSWIAALAVLVDWREAAVVIADARPGPVLAALAVSVVGVLISADKWRGLLARASISLPLRATARLYWVGMFFSNFLPTSVGGDAVRLAMTPSGGRLARVAGSILVERLTGLLVMLVLCVLGLVLRPWHIDGTGLERVLPAVVCGLGLGATALLLVPGLFVRLLPHVADRLPDALRRVIEPVRKVAVAIADQAGDRVGIGRALLLSLPFYGTIILAQYLVLEAVGADVPLLEVALVAPIVPLLALLPLSINGLGLAEGVFVLVYSQLGVAPELALAAAVLRRLVDLANSALGGVLWFLHREAERRRAIAAETGDWSRAPGQAGVGASLPAA